MTGASVAFPHQGGRRPAILPVDLTVAAGQFIAFVGPSGCGKSTILNLVAGFVQATQGRVAFRGADVCAINTDVGYMTQIDALLPWRTTAENVALPLIVRGSPQAAAMARAGALLQSVGLGDYGRHYPKELSGGMRKRAALAQILAYEPSTILMDEPFGALDAHMRLVMQQEVTRIVETRGVTVILVTHDIDEAVALADRIMIFSGHPGRIVRELAIDFPRPRDVLAVRRDPRFRELFDQVWNELVPAFAEAEQGAAS